MADEPLPPIIASRQTDSEIAITRAQADIEWRTRQVTANLLRIIAGAGRPFDLFEQMRRLHVAIGSVPPETMVGQVTDAMLAALSNEDVGPTDYFERPIDTMERGALRKAASRIVGQATQMAAGDSLIWEGFRALEQRREDQRREREATLRRPSAPTKRRRTVKAKSTKAPKLKPTPKPEPAQPEDEPRTTVEFMRKRAKAIEQGER